METKDLPDSSAVKKSRIGFYGNMANNMYLCAKAFSGRGSDAVFIKDYGSRHAFSQPIWEDLDISIEYDELMLTDSWSWDQWTEFEKKKFWQPPIWYIDAGKKSSRGRHSLGGGNLLERMCFRLLYYRRKYWKGVLSVMKTCDILVVCGIEAAILAMASGLPFVYVSYGGDMRIALGGEEPALRHPQTWIYFMMCRKLFRRALTKAIWISSGRFFMDGKAGFAGDFLPDTSYRFFPLPYRIRKRLPQVKRRENLSLLTEKMGISIPNSDLYCMVPSRVDFFWKGQDWLFRSIPKIRGGKKIHFIFSGWGQDYKKAIQMVDALNVKGDVTFLPCALSKQLLFSFFESVDFVIDQFHTSYYGTSAMEAMSCGTPVVMNIDESMFVLKGNEPPPVLNAGNEEGLTLLLSDISSGGVDLEFFSKSVFEWAQRIHGEKRVVSWFFQQVSAFLLKTKKNDSIRSGRGRGVGGYERFNDAAEDGNANRTDP